MYKTSKWVIEGQSSIEDLSAKKQGAIVAFFHGRLAMMPFAWKSSHHPFYMLLSDHSDGRFIAKVIRQHGIKSVYGSSTRGGANAMLSLIKILKKGGFIGITPDGPKGPCHKVSEGVIQIARLASAPIILGAFHIKRHKQLKTWDKFMLPLPFSKGIILLSDPIWIQDIPLDEDVNQSPCLYEDKSPFPIEHYQKHLQRLMLDHMQKADKLNYE